MSTLSVNAVTDANGGNTATINSMTPTADSLQGFRNRIINGDMRIDQRNAGASVTNTGSTTFYLDRWVGLGTTSAGQYSVQQVTSSAPIGFTYSAKITVTTIDSSLAAADRYIWSHRIEGYNIADFNFGTANAKTITLSFWVRSSETGTFGGAVTNGNTNRSYPFQYTINSADTWEQKTVTFAGDTTGTWQTDNSRAMQVFFSLGAGSDYDGTANTWSSGGYYTVAGSKNLMATLNATFYITGVQLEVGSVATPFERRPYGTELALCQRYYYQHVGGSAGEGMIGPANYYASNDFRASLFYKQTMRTAPTLVIVNSASAYRFLRNAGSEYFSILQNAGGSSSNAFHLYEVTSGQTGGIAGSLITSTSGAFIGFSAEL